MSESTGHLAGSVPWAPGPIIGRGTEMAILDGLWDEGRRLVTIHGPPGVGKTRLAMAAAEAHGGRVVFCQLADALAVPDLLDAVGRSVGLALGDEADALQVGRAVSAAGVSLVVLDNLEQIASEAADVVGTWATAATEVRWLVTSRHRLGLPGEQLLPLGPLETDAAVALLADSWSRLAPADSGWSPEEAEAARRVAEAVDGLPLALELAASRLSVMGLDALATALEGRLAVLEDPVSRRPARQRSLTAALAWSWELLEPWMRTALHQCSVFRGSFDLAAAEAVLALPDGAPGVVDALQRMQGVSLLWTERAGGARRFRMLRSVVEGAEDIVGDDVSLDPARRRHASCYAALAEAGGLHADDVENLLAALAVPGLAAQSRVRIACGLEELLSRRGRFERAETALRDVLVDAEAIPRPLRVRARLALARALCALSRLDEAHQACEAALADARSEGAPGLVAAAAFERSRVCWAGDDYGRAFACEEAVLAELEAAPAGRELMGLRVAHDMSRSLIGRREEAYGELARWLELARGVDDPRLMGLHEMTGIAALLAGRVEAAHRHYAAGCEAARRFGDRATQGWLGVFEAHALVSMGAVEAGRQRTDEALELLEAFGRRWHVGHALHLSAELAARQGDTERATDELSAAEALARRTGNTKLRSLVAQSRSLAAFVAGDRAQARRLADAALELLAGRGDPEGRAWILASRAISDEDGPARTHLAEAERLLAGSGRTVARVQLALATALVDVAAGRPGAEGTLTDVLAPRLLAGESRPRPDVARFVWTFFTARLLDRALEPAARARAWIDALDPARAALVVTADGSFARPPGATELVDLSGREQVAAVLRALAGAGSALAVPALLELAWPGERMRFEAGRNRVYAALSELRRRGLADVIARDGDGYRLAGAVRVVPDSLGRWISDEFGSVQGATRAG